LKGGVHQRLFNFVNRAIHLCEILLQKRENCREAKWQWKSESSLGPKSTTQLIKCEDHAYVFFFLQLLKFSAF